MKDWKRTAEELFFISNEKINDIAISLGVSRKSVSAHLKECDGFLEEKQRRKAVNAGKRKEYQADWDKRNRGRGGHGAALLEGQLLRRQHEIDVKVLSCERFFNETGV